MCHEAPWRLPRRRDRRLTEDEVPSPALVAWQQQHRETFGTEILHAPLETWPGNYPNLEQVRFLLQNGIREPILAILTRIGTVEGLGVMIRFLAPSDMQRLFVEDIVGTATAHLSKGLAEVHAGDEAGWEEEAGHDRMWYAVREIAVENPVTSPISTWGWSC